MSYILLFFFFNDTATTEIYTLSLHDALPIYLGRDDGAAVGLVLIPSVILAVVLLGGIERLGSWSVKKTMLSFSLVRSEEHTSELQSRQYLVCRLLLEKKKKYSARIYHTACHR